MLQEDDSDTEGKVNQTVVRPAMLYGGEDRRYD